MSANNFMTIQQDLDRIKELEGKATENWYVDPERKGVIRTKDDPTIGYLVGISAELIATLRNKALKMVRVIEIQREALKDIKDLHDCAIAETALTETEKIWEDKP